MTIRDVEFYVQKEPWMKKSECSDPDIDPDLWFPHAFVQKDPKVDLAISLCNICVVKRECLEFALTNWPVEGIWGGLRERQLKELHNQIKGEK